jgi:hypothetical protein
MIFQNAIVLLINLDGVCVLCEQCKPFFLEEKKKNLRHLLCDLPCFPTAELKMTTHVLGD